MAKDKGEAKEIAADKPANVTSTTTTATVTTTVNDPNATAEERLAALTAEQEANRTAG